MVKTAAADFVRGQIAAAVQAGATAHLDSRDFPQDAPGTPYMAPQVLTGVTHDMSVMTEESFGPVVGIMKVASDEEAVRSEEHTSELQSLMRISYAVFCLIKQKNTT